MIAWWPKAVSARWWMTTTVATDMVTSEVTNEYF